MSDQALYARHIHHRRQHMDHLLNEMGFDVLFIHSGRLAYPRFDDRALPFRVHGHFNAWVPLPYAPDCLLELHAGKQPILWYLQPDDFWHLPPAAPEHWWAKEFDVRIIKDASEWTKRFDITEATAAIGEEGHLAGLGEHIAINPPLLLQALDEHRTRKTEYECWAIYQASLKAARAHNSAHRAFLEGNSELQVFHAYLASLNEDPQTLPYDGIVAINEHAATLHYQHRHNQAPQQHRSFLLDAGADHLGYASDITRTHVGNIKTPESSLFQGLIDAMDHLERRLAQSAKVGHSFVDMHQQAHLGIAEILSQTELVTGSIESIVEGGITRVFFPHGLGHFLGTQVHDVAGQVSPAGDALPPPPRDPMLRLTRTLEAGNVVTIEPGLYFIPMLLDQFKRQSNADQVHWDRVEALIPYGGIRIEDNVLVSEGEPVNYTREAFDAIE